MDIEKTSAVFEKLGYAGGAIAEDELRKVRIRFLRNGSECVELVAPLAEDAPIKTTLKNMRGATPYHICYCTGDIEAECLTLRKLGWVQTEKPAPAPAIGGRKVVFLYHKDAGLIELVED
ncbi:MAG: VOC family protein [Lachnospiraceae bacterium]|nr:VOC family protein [Lachnospiraceae bacterium]